MNQQAVRIIPKLLVARTEIGRTSRDVVVRTSQFSSRTTVGSLQSQVKILEAQKADEFMIIFIDQQLAQDRDLVLEVVAEVRREVSVPITVGGGLADMNWIGELLASGADRVCVGLSALRNPLLLSHTADLYGAQAVMASLDIGPRQIGAKGLFMNLRNGSLLELSAVQDLLRSLVEHGAGQLHIHDMERDGSGMGFDVEFLNAVLSPAVDVPVVLSGGCGTAHHFVEAFSSLGVSGVAASTYFARRDQNPLEVRAHATNSGLKVRRLF